MYIFRSSLHPIKLTVVRVENTYGAESVAWELCDLAVFLNLSLRKQVSWRTSWILCVEIRTPSQSYVVDVNSGRNK